MSIVNALMHISSAIAQQPDPIRKAELHEQLAALSERLSADLWAFFEGIDPESREEE